MTKISNVHGNEQNRIKNDWTTEQIDDIEQRIYKAVTIPVKVEIHGNHRVLNLEEARKYLEDAWLIVIMDCVCRAQMHNCDKPLNVCLRLNERGEQALTNDELRTLNPRKATIEEGLNVLNQSHKAGLVHLALAVDKEGINEICSCCSCCCLVLASVLRSGSAHHLLLSTTIAETDTTTCTHCGVCIERCQFGARDMVNGAVVFNPDLCCGCGLCVSSCPNHAITLNEKPSGQVS